MNRREQTHLSFSIQPKFIVFLARWLLSDILVHDIFAKPFAGLQIHERLGAGLQREPQCGVADGKGSSVDRANGYAKQIGVHLGELRNVGCDLPLQGLFLDFCVDFADGGA